MKKKKKKKLPNSEKDKGRKLVEGLNFSKLGSK